MQSKADQVLLRAEAIATQRVQGATWPQIATWLRGEGLDVSDGQVRVYWHRRYGSAPPALVLAEASARAWERRYDHAQQTAAYWEAHAQSTKAEAQRLAQALEAARGQAQAAQAESARASRALAEVAAPEPVPDHLIALFKQAGYAEAQEEISAAIKARDAAKQTADGWSRFGRELAEAHKTGNVSAVAVHLARLIAWAYPAKPGSGV